MLRKIAYLVGCAGAKSMANLQDLPLLLNTMDIEGTRVHLSQLQGIQSGLVEGQQLLQNNVDPATVAVALEVVDKVAGFVGAAVKWIDESSDKAADVERITAALSVVRDNRVTLVKYSEQLLDQSIKALALSAHQVYGAMQQVKSMAKIVKAKSIDTKDWMEQIAELDDIGDIKDTWEVAVKDLTNVLTEAHTRTTQIHGALDNTLNTMVKMRATIDSMVERTTIDINSETARLADELAEQERKLAEYGGGCFSSVGEGFKTIFSLGMSCLAKDATERKVRRMRDAVQKQANDYSRSIEPLVGKLAGVGDAARMLLDASYSKFEKIGDFMDALAKANMYFMSASAKNFSDRARKTHTRKLDELVAACDIMLYHSEHNMEIFKAINTGTGSLDVGRIKKEQVRDTAAEKAKIEAEENAQYDRDVAKLKAELEAKLAQGKIKGMQLIDLRALKEGIVQGPQFLI